MKELQIKREQQILEEGINKFKEEIHKAIKTGNFDKTPYGMLLYNLGYMNIKDKIQEYLDSTQKGDRSKVQNYIKLYNEDAEALAYVVLTSALRSVAVQGTLTVTALSIMGNLKQIYRDKALKETNPKLYSYLGYEFRRASNKRKKMLIKKHLKSLDDPYNFSNTAIDLKAGTTLIDLVIKSGSGLFELITTTKEKKRTNKPLHNIKVLVLTKEAKHILSTLDAKSVVANIYMHKPLLVPPRDWTSTTNGGFYVLPSRFLLHKPNQGIQNKKINREDFTSVFRIINKLQRIPWRINKRMYKLIKYVFTQDLRLGGAPPARVRTWEELIDKPEGEVSKEEWHKFNKEREKLIIKLDAEFGKRLELVYALGVAEEMLGYDVPFYYVYQVDYRGRIYPNDSYLNLLKGSIIKSLLEFGEGEYLTQEGKYWLAIHLANTYGLDKAPYNERLQWVYDNYNLILTVAEDPLANVSLWNDVDSPYEFVAACQAYLDDLNGEKVYLPIQLDATCSGIQMYSGLLRDKKGGESVNVIGTTRNDIYQRVQHRAEELLTEGRYDPILTYTTKDRETHSTLTHKFANELKGNITRQLVKRPTMTVPYNVTKYGMQEQQNDELVKLEEEGKAFWSVDTWFINKVLTDVTYTAIYNIVKGAKIGRDYLVAVANTLDSPAKWYTPIYNFPVIQQTYKSKAVRINTLLGTLTLRKQGANHVRRIQANQIAPNFIHSIDATVLYGVVDRQEGNIGTIHDCFLVPPNSGGLVQNNYKEAYVETMRADPLRLFQQQVDPEETIPLPEYGNLNLDDVFDAEYIIS